MSENGQKLSELPQGWVQCSGDLIFNFVTSGSRGWAKYYADSGAAFLRMGNLNHASITLDLQNLQRVQLPSSVEGIRSLVQGRDLLISITADVGMIALVPVNFEEAYINQHVALARPSTAISSAYIAWFLASQEGGQKQFKELQRGATKTGLGLDDIRAVQIPLPSLAEQHRIVNKIEELFTQLDAGVDLLKKLKVKLKRYRQAVLKAAVEGKLTQDWRAAHQDELEPASVLLDRILKERREKWEADQLAKMEAKGKVPKDDKWKLKYKEPAAPDVGKLSELPEGWIWTTVEQINPLNRPCAYGVLQPGRDVEKGTRLIRVGDINDGHISIAGMKQINPEIAGKYPRTNLFGGEVLITLVGAIGRTAVVPSSLAGSNTARAVGVMPLNSEVLSEWVEIWFRNPSKIQEMTSKAHEVARKTLNLEDVRTTTVAIPPYQEQQHIYDEVEYYSSLLDAIDELIEKSLKKSEKLRQSILKQAFEGKLVDISKI